MSWILKLKCDSIDISNNSFFGTVYDVFDMFLINEKVTKFNSLFFGSNNLTGLIPNLDTLQLDLSNNPLIRLDYPEEDKMHLSRNNPWNINIEDDFPNINYRGQSFSILNS